VARFAFGAPSTPLPASEAFAQNFPANALSFASHLIAALPVRNAISDVTLTRPVTLIGWLDTETGPSTMLALGTNESRINFGPASGTRTEIREASVGVTQGYWIAQEGFSGLVCLSELQGECGVVRSPWLSECSSQHAALLRRTFGLISTNPLSL
jgi:hypothetical protein